jgi:hypothetical protein
MKTERTIWVAYIRGKGFLTGGKKDVKQEDNSTGRSYRRKKRVYTTSMDFTKARMFKEKHHAEAAAHNTEDELVPVPIKMTIEPEVLTLLELGGSVDESV